MKRLMTVTLMVGLMAFGAASAQDDALGLYFSSSTFNLGTSSATNAPGFMIASHIVLTNPTGAVIDGYEVGISCSAADFAIPLTSLMFDLNLGTNANQIVTFLSPKPVVAGGTVLSSVFLATASTDFESISFGAASPSSLPGDAPVIDYGIGGLAACSQPFGTSVVAWLNGLPVSEESSTWGGVKALYR